jgi:hypothetical protein
VIGDRPAHDPAAECVPDDGGIDLAFAGGMLGDVHRPEPVRRRRVERSVDEIIAGLGVEIPAGAAPTPASVDAGDTGLSHQSLDPLAGAAQVLAESELGVHAGRAVGPAAHPVDVDDRVGQHGVVVVTIAARLGKPRVEPGGRHLHHSAARRDREVRAVFGDEGEDHFGRTFSQAK